MEDNVRVTVRLPADMVDRLNEMIAKGRYGNLSEAIRDCIQEYLDSHPDVLEGLEKERPSVDMETLIEKEPVSMEVLIREAAKKYTKDHIDN